MEDINKHYTTLGQKCGEIQITSLDPKYSELLSKSHAVIFDFNSIIEVLKDRPEYEILRIAIREYQLSIMSLNSGLYNQAFIGLRFYFERSLIAIMFSSKELDLRLWQKGERDTYWSEIIDENSGVFSHNFCRAFFPDLKDEAKHYRTLSQKVYRECSEYVHGNLSVQSRIPVNLEFSEFLLTEWHAKADTIVRILLFSFCLRYLRFIKPDLLKRIEPIILEEFGFLPAISEIFNK